MHAAVGEGRRHWFGIILSVSCLLVFFALEGRPWCSEGEVRFDIREFRVKGNTLMDYAAITSRLAFYTGKDMSASDVEKARKYLEDLYHGEGYPTVLVNIPPQDVEDGVVTLEVIESTIGEVRVTGNRYHTREKILSRLTSFRRGEILYIPRVQQELNRINRNPDLKVTPLLMPGKTLGTTDVELKVMDHFPLHGSLELNNRGTQDTTDLRLNGVIRYDNLWQKEHGITVQYQTSPEDRDEVKVYAFSYVMPAPWNDDDTLAGYAVWSDSATAFGEGFETIGEGRIFGIQYVVGLPFMGMYAHSLSVGLDYKDFKDTLGYEDVSDDDTSVKTPITYMPLSVSYRGTLYGASGTTGMDGGVRVSFRGLVSDLDEFEDKRYKARGNYLYIVFGIERDQKLPAGSSVFVRLEGQAADQPLISNEQYAAGGMKSVRGYRENEESGDHALRWTGELRAPDLAGAAGLPEAFTFTPFLFYEGAALRIIDPLSGEDRSKGLQGAGAGARGRITRMLDYECSWGWALEDTDRTDRGDSLFNFAVKAQF